MVRDCAKLPTTSTHLQDMLSTKKKRSPKKHKFMKKHHLSQGTIILTNSTLAELFSSSLNNNKQPTTQSTAPKKRLFSAPDRFEPLAMSSNERIKVRSGSCTEAEQVIDLTDPDSPPHTPPTSRLKKPRPTTPSTPIDLCSSASCSSFESRTSTPKARNCAWMTNSSRRLLVDPSRTNSFNTRGNSSSTSNGTDSFYTCDEADSCEIMGGHIGSSVGISSVAKDIGRKSNHTISFGRQTDHLKSPIAPLCAKRELLRNPIQRTTLFPEINFSLSEEEPMDVPPPDATLTEAVVAQEPVVSVPSVIDLSGSVSVQPSSPLPVVSTAVGGAARFGTTGSPAVMHSGFIAALKQKMRQESVAYLEELKALALEYNIPASPWQERAPQSWPTLYSRTSETGHPFSSSFNCNALVRSGVPVQEAALLVTGEGSDASLPVDFLALLCDHFVLSETANPCQMRSAERVLHAFLQRCPPRRGCAAVESVYDHTLRHVCRSSTRSSGRSVLSQLMGASEGQVCVLKWINSVLLSDLSTYCFDNESSAETSPVRSTRKEYCIQRSPLVLTFSGIDCYFGRFSSMLRKRKDSDKEEDFLSECLVLLQLHISALYAVRDLSRIAEFGDGFSQSLKQCGIPYNSKVLDKVLPANFRKRLRRTLKH